MFSSAPAKQAHSAAPQSHRASPYPPPEPPPSVPAASAPPHSPQSRDETAQHPLPLLPGNPHYPQLPSTHCLSLLQPPQHDLNSCPPQAHIQMSPPLQET